MDKKTILDFGYHLVQVTKIYEGVSTIGGYPYINCYFENNEGYIPQRFYDTEDGKPILDNLFAAVGLNGNEVNTEDLVRKILIIKVVDDSQKNNEFPKKVTGLYKTNATLALSSHN